MTQMRGLITEAITPSLVDIMLGAITAMVLGCPGPVSCVRLLENWGLIILMSVLSLIMRRIGKRLRKDVWPPRLVPNVLNTRKMTVISVKREPRNTIQYVITTQNMCKSL